MPLVMEQGLVSKLKAESFGHFISIWEGLSSTLRFKKKSRSSVLRLAGCPCVFFPLEVEGCWVHKKQDPVPTSRLPPQAHARFDLRVKQEGCSPG